MILYVSEICEADYGTYYATEMRVMHPSAELLGSTAQHDKQHLSILATIRYLMKQTEVEGHCHITTSKSQNDMLLCTTSRSMQNRC